MAQQAVLGILLLDTRFPRIPGDVGHPDSYPFPIRGLTVPGATVERVMTEANLELAGPFVEAARQLEAEGVSAITSSCGFLSPLQQAVARAVKVPVFMSSLMQVPCAYAMTQRRIGIVTASQPRLTPPILRSAGIPESIPLAIGGLQDKRAFRDPILDDGDALDRQELETSVVHIVQALQRQHPEIGAFVLECHNLAPYAGAVASATGRPVFDVISFAQWVYSAIVKREFPDPQAA